MKRLIALAVVTLASQALVTFAGEPVGSSNQADASSKFFRPNEFDVGAFGTYAIGVDSGAHAGNLHAWGGGQDVSYWSRWKYGGFRLQGTEK
jgi:hypothetical protein